MRCETRADGLYIAYVVPGSMLRALGIRSGDLVVRIDDEAVSDFATLDGLFAKRASAKGRMTVVIVRRDDPQILTWTFR